MQKNPIRLAVAAMIMILILSACGPAATAAPVATEPPATEAGLQIPDVEDGKFNIAMVLIGPHDDGGWSQAHYEGLVYVEENVPNTHVAYIENVPEGADSEQVFRSLARKGFDLIFGTSYGYMDPMETVAGEFPDQMFIHLTGIKTNSTNFGNLMGAMENMKYLAGMLAGARAKQDGVTKLGYMATFPIPEELRLGNAIALGMGRPALSAPWMCVGSIPGMIPSSKRKPRLHCLMAVRRLCSLVRILLLWPMLRRKKANGV